MPVAKMRPEGITGHRPRPQVPVRTARRTGTAASTPPTKPICSATAVNTKSVGCSRTKSRFVRFTGSRLEKMPFPSSPPLPTAVRVEVVVVPLPERILAGSRKACESLLLVVLHDPELEQLDDAHDAGEASGRARCRQSAPPMIEHREQDPHQDEHRTEVRLDEHEQRERRGRGRCTGRSPGTRGSRACRRCTRRARRRAPASRAPPAAA